MNSRFFAPAAHRAIALLLVLIAFAAFAACSPSDESDSRVRGEIVSVQPRSIDTFESLTIRDSDGNLWTFGPGRVPHFSPSHLIEHQANGDIITVTYRAEADGGLAVVSIDE